nr:reverse transcriptase domain-containing protein [Tanacetum cinerariifolium]
MVKEGNVLGHKISKNEIEVVKAKVDVIAKLRHPTTIKGIRSFLGHVGFYRRFIKYFSKIARPITRLLEKHTPFFFSKEYLEAFQTLKRKLTESQILIAPDWDLPFELMCDASDFAIGAVLRQRQEKHFRPIHYIKSSEGVYMARKPLTFSRLATMDPLRDIMARTTQPRRCLILDSIGLLFTVMAKIYSKLVTFVNIKERFRNEMRCQKFHPTVDYLSKWVEAKALPTNDARVVCKFLKNLFGRFGTLHAIINDRGAHLCNDQFAKVMVKFGVTHRLATPVSPPNKWSSGGIKPWFKTNP